MSSMPVTKRGAGSQGAHRRVDAGAYACEPLGPVERLLAERHLVECANCRRELARFVKVAFRAEDAAERALLDSAVWRVSVPARAFPGTRAHPWRRR